MSLSKSEKKLREDAHRHKTQLCTVMGYCRHLSKGSCKFAHALEELRPTPQKWTTTKGHYWEQGKPLPDQEVLELIEQYAALSSQLPEWVTDLRPHTEEGPPQKRARREEDKEWWEEEAEEEEQEEDWEAVQQEDWESQESEEAKGHNPFLWTGSSLSLMNAWPS